LKFLIDVCVSDNVPKYLLKLGHEIVFVSERDPRMLDEDILHWASEDNFVLVTNDKDFGRFIFLGRRPHGGLIRLPSARGAIQVSLMSQILDKHLANLSEGAVVTATRERIRVRKGMIE